MRHEMFRVVHSSRARNSMPGAEFQVMRQKGPHSPMDPTPTMLGSHVDSRSKAPLAAAFRPGRPSIGLTAWQRPRGTGREIERSPEGPIKEQAPRRSENPDP